MNGMIFTHIPLHEESLGRFGTNVHGHLHYKRVMKDGMVDPRYFNVSVEQTDYAPITLEEVNERILKEGGHVGFRNGNGPMEVM